jgi:hypothetical protein
VIVIVVAAVAVGVGIAVGVRLKRVRRADHMRPVRRILLPFTGASIPRRALEASLRLARAENATLMPAFLATVPRHLPLDAAVPAQCSLGMPVLEEIEAVAARSDVPVDARIGRGRTYRHALEQLLEEEPVDRVIVPASGNPRSGLSGDDIVWLLERVPAEVLILRPTRV